jgi:hypothetical protein
MNKGWIIATILAVGLAGCESEEHEHGGKKLDEQEIKLSVDQLPPAVKATLVEESRGAKLDEITKETEDGKTVYSADFMAGKNKYEATVAADGTLLKKELDNDEKDEDEKEHH